jgi:perosamine synthetase
MTTTLDSNPAGSRGEIRHIPVTRPYMDEAEAQAAAAAIRSGWIAQGPLVAEFEAACAARIGSKHAVAVTNCTSALHIALICSGIGPDDEVIVPSFTFVASANAIRHVGARPVFVDIDPSTYNLDPCLLEAALSPATRGIMTVDQIGLPSDLDAVSAFARKHGLAVVEDAAPAMGSSYKGRAVGSISPITCFSFHPRKSISTGEGGLLATDSDDVAARAKLLRSHGASVSDLARHNAKSVVIEDYVEVGYNYRMTDIQAAIGLEQLKKLDFILDRRRHLAARYGSIFADMPGVTPPFVPEYATHTFQSYAVRIDPKVADRDSVMHQMLDKGISTRRGVMAIHEAAAYASTLEGRVSLPVTEAATRQTLLLPIYTTMSDDDLDYVIESLNISLRA